MSEKAQEETKPRIIPVEDIINNYPIDREKVRDVILLEISKKLERIAICMEKFVVDTEELIKEPDKDVKDI